MSASSPRLCAHLAQASMLLLSFMIVVTLAISGQTAVADQDSFRQATEEARRIADAYAQHLASLKSFSLNVNRVEELSGAVEGGPRHRYSRFTLCRDLDRIDFDFANIKLAPDGSEMLDRQLRARRIVANERVLSYDIAGKSPPSRVMLFSDVKRVEQIIASSLGDAGPILGYSPGAGGISLVSLLVEHATELKVRGVEVIDGANTHVLEALTPYGRYTLWLDPSLRFQPRKIEVQKQAGDLADNHKPLSTPLVPLPKGAKLDYPYLPLKAMSIIVRVTKFEEAGGTPLPVKCEAIRVQTFADDQKVTFRNTISASKFLLRPNFEGEKAFVADLPDGTIIIDLEKPNITHIWKGGKVEQSIDRATVQSIEENVERAKKNLKSNDKDDTKH